MTIKTEIEKLRKALSLNLTPISGRENVKVTAEYLGLSEADMDTEVSTKEFLTLHHNGVIHQAYIDNPELENWKERCQPVPGISQEWKEGAIQATPTILSRN